MYYALFDACVLEEDGPSTRKESGDVSQAMVGYEVNFKNTIGEMKEMYVVSDQNV